MSMVEMSAHFRSLEVTARFQRMRWSSVIGALLVLVAVASVNVHYLLQPLRLLGQTEYDDGVHYAAGFEFASGVMPYKDFFFSQPPGIVYLMVPFAWIGRWLGTGDGLAAARIFTAFIVCANSLLVYRVALKRTSVVPALLAGAGLAFYPFAEQATHTVMLEPYVVFFLLVAVNLAFATTIPTSKALILAGVSFGFGTAVKVWEIVPFGIALIILAVVLRQRALKLVYGYLAGLLVPILPFLILAPSALVHETIFDQFTRATSGVAGTGPRLSTITGLGAFSWLSGSLTEHLVIGVVAVLAILVFFTRHLATRYDYFVFTGAIASLLMFLKSPVFWPHYAYFSAAFICLSVASAVSLIAKGASAYLPKIANRRPTLYITALCLIGLFLFSSYAARSTILGSSFPYDPSAITPTIPAGSCVIADQEAGLVGSNLLGTEPANCPVVIDSWGINNLELKNLSQTKLKLQWEKYFIKANYVVLSAPLAPNNNNSNIPNSDHLAHWFRRYFKLVQIDNPYYVYQHRRSTQYCANEPQRSLSPCI